MSVNANWDFVYDAITQKTGGFTWTITPESNYETRITQCNKTVDISLYFNVATAILDNRDVEIGKLTGVSKPSGSGYRGTCAIGNSNNLYTVTGIAYAVVSASTGTLYIRIPSGVTGTTAVLINITYTVD